MTVARLGLTLNEAKALPKNLGKKASASSATRSISPLAGEGQVPSGMWLEFGMSYSPGNMKLSFQAARSIG